MVTETNLLPAVPNVGESAVFSALVQPPYRDMPLFAVFRSHEETFSIPLEPAPSLGEGVFGCLFPAQKKEGIWYCLIGAGRDSNKLKYSIPEVFLVTGEKREYRALWVDSWNAGFLSPRQARKLVETARLGNINALIVEVRKIGDAYYDSALEPLASNIATPSFDPLKTLIELCHDTSGGKKRLELHAWVVAYRIYKGREGAGFPPSPHILSRHPEWVSLNHEGQHSEKGTVYLDPGVPGVMDYNIDVCLDIIRKYEVDGINFDYIRYPSTGWGYNPIALGRFQKLTGRTDRPAPTDSQWRAFHREQVSHFLRKVYIRLIAEKPNLKVSVCTTGWGDIKGGDFTRTDAYKGGIQDWARWHRDHLLDVNFRMGYKRQHNASQKQQFENWTRFTLNHQCFRLSPIGLGSYLNTIDGTLEQLRTAREYGANGLVFYNYHSPSKDQVTRSDFFSTIRARAYPEWLDVPPLAWKISNPNGTLAGTARSGGKALDGARISLDQINLETITDGTGFYAFMDVPPGSYQLTVNGSPAGTSTVHASGINEFNIDLR